MADYNKNTDVDTTNNTSDTEPATGHDVGIGGGLGAVGGAIVGGLAGGPIGAVIGAIAGGAVSAGAVDVVDKHDHDYARTAPDADTTTTGTYANTTPAAGTEYTGIGDYQRTPAMTTADMDDTDIVPVSDVYDTAAPANTYGNETDRTVQLHEERLDVSKQNVQAGEVTLRKEVITETKNIDVPVTREEVVIERHAASGTAASGSFDDRGEEVLRVPVMEEQVTVSKTPIVTEEISLGKRAVTETQHVSDTVRREEAYIDNPDNVDVLERSDRK